MLCFSLGTVPLMLGFGSFFFRTWEKIYKADLKDWCSSGSGYGAVYDGTGKCTVRSWKQISGKGNGRWYAEQ